MPYYHHIINYTLPELPLNENAHINVAIGSVLCQRRIRINFLS